MNDAHGSESMLLLGSHSILCFYFRARAASYMTCYIKVGLSGLELFTEMPLKKVHLLDIDITSLRDRFGKG